MFISGFKNTRIINVLHMENCVEIYHLLVGGGGGEGELSYRKGRGDH